MTNKEHAALEVFFSSGAAEHKASKEIVFNELDPMRLQSFGGTTSHGHKCWIQYQPIRVFCTCEHFKFRILPKINEAMRHDIDPPLGGCKHVVALAYNYLHEQL